MLDFQKIPKVENYKFYLEAAFSAARRKGDQIKIQGNPEWVDRQKRIEAARLDTVGGRLNASLGKVLHSFPSIDSLPVFHRELIRALLDWGQLKKSLGAVNWVLKKISFFQRLYQQKIRQCSNRALLARHKNEFYGRISSVLKQVNPELNYLENARKTFRQFPVIREGLKNVVIIGFPNVGKTTLISKLTTSRPEINTYPFTTKNINVGYIEQDGKAIQLLDVPGTLNRFERMNAIEKQAHLALKYLADLVVYVFDLTEEYPLADQVRLWNEVRQQEKPVIAYLSKTDILEDYEAFANKHGCITDAAELRKLILAKV